MNANEGKEWSRDTAQGSVYDHIYFTDDELKQGEEINRQAQAGLITKESAHNWWQNKRAGYGYDGGEDGHGFTTLADQAKNDSTGYTGRYQSAMDQAANAILNRKAFSYDAESDPMYQQYKDSYTRQGKQAMEDTLAQVSARTGGLASSYAGTAAQQTYDGYMAALADKVPELRQLAYQMYMDEGNTMRQNLQMLQGLDTTEYGRYRDGVADSQWQKEFDTQNSQWQKEFDTQNSQWQKEFDTQNSQWQKEFDFEKGLTAASLLAQSGNYSGYKDLFDLSDEDVAALGEGYINEKDLQTAELLAQAGDFSGYQKIFNLSPEKVAKLEKVFQQQNAPKVMGGGGGGSKYTKAQADAAVASALAGHTEDPYVRSIIEGYFGMPMEAYLAGQTPEKGRGYDDAVNYVKTNFVYDPDAAWDYLDRQYKKGAIGGDEALYIFDTILGFNSDNYKPKVGSIGIGIDMSKYM